MKHKRTGKLLLTTVIIVTSCGLPGAQDLKLNDLGYFERQGVSVLVFSNSFNGGFNALDDAERMISINSDDAELQLYDGTTEQAYNGSVQTWGPYYKYNYVKFDFTSVRQPGIYYIRYGDTKTNNFLIDAHVYDKITDATTDVWVPIHMNHMYVTEGYRTWHGEPFREGYLQAPPSDHFDLHSQGQATDTKYKPYELIPGLNIGGFFDAGDFDIETGSNVNVVQNLIRAWELFKPQRDETFVSQQQRYVELHRPDGTPDILQFIEHGILNLVAQAEQIGHMAQTLSNAVLDNYHHLGDAASITDGLHYDPSLKPYEVSSDGKRSGTPDDMWAFTTRNPRLDLQAAGVFTSAARVLRGYNDELANRAQKQANRLRQEAYELIAKNPHRRNRQAEEDNDWLTGTGDGNTQYIIFGSSLKNIVTPES